MGQYSWPPGTDLFRTATLYQLYLLTFFKQNKMALRGGELYLERRLPPLSAFPVVSNLKMLSHAVEAKPLTFGQYPSYCSS